ncbi:hypothetical protein K474DRAFT_1589184 [Panus rudis PR-1116 ss-1]|nr:hypothetical protein K474DRAFT_1589184 [Panus rudis PR-1116 ss-1]
MSQDPAIRQIEKQIATEARSEEKNLQHAIKDLESAEKTHNKSIKAADKAQHALDKAVQKEHKAASALNKAAHQHDAAIAHEQTAEKNVTLKHQHEERLEQDLAKRRASVEELRHRKNQNDQQREMKLSQVHAQAASRAGSLDLGPQNQHPNGVGPGGEPMTNNTALGLGPAGANA